MTRLSIFGEALVSLSVAVVLPFHGCDWHDGGHSGGKGGHAGAGGSAGTSGTGTSGTGGSAGTSGTGGSAGTSGTGGSGVVLTPAERAQLQTLTPLPAVPADTTNRHADDPAAAALGQKLFFDAEFSGPLKVASDLGPVGAVGKVSCASCHASAYLDDDRSVPETVSLGADFHTRNSPTLVNASFYRWTNWGGRFSAQWELPIAVVESGVIMNGNRLKLAHRIFDVYRSEYEAVFGALDPALADFPAEGKPKPAPTDANPNPPDGAWEGMTAAQQQIVNRVLVNYAKAIAAYMRKLVSRNAPLDRFMAGETGALDLSAQRGARLFVGKARCIACHSGPHFSDDRFHNLGVPQTGEKVPASDDGRFKDVPPLLSSAFSSRGAYSDDPDAGLLEGLTNPMPETARGAFRTPDLRGVALTAPYMHSGQLATLQAVIDFYDAGGGTPVSGAKDPLLVPLQLTAQEKSDLLSFLGALTGDPIPPALRTGAAQ
jgi:cytochrome c peroxidase